MTQLYSILKTSKLGAGAAPDMYTALFAQKIKGGGEAELSGVPPLTFTADGTPLIDYLISGNTTQNGTPTPDNPIMPQGTGDLETVGEKAGQYKIPISSANTTTPIYLGEVQTTRKIKKRVLDGTESWFVNQTISTEDTIYFYTTVITDSTFVPGYSVCSHFEYKDAYYIRNENGYHLLSGYGGLRIRIMRAIADTPSDFKAYLAAQYAAGTPVTVWYVLAEPETAVVNEPLMKIGDYADTVSKAQAGVQIPTNNGSTTVDVETTLKPSEVYIKYHT